MKPSSTAAPQPPAAEPAASSDTSAAALRFHALGFDPIALIPGQKRPLSAAWQTHHGRTPEALAAEWQANPGAGVGLLTGRGLVVIDLDLKPGISGAASLAEVQATVGPLPRTVTVRTASGGQHLYFRVPADAKIRNSVSAVGPGIDVRGEGGQVVAPPTVLADGRTYEWVGQGEPGAMTVPAELPPGWVALLSALAAPSAPAAGPSAPAVERLDPPVTRDQGIRRARSYVAKIAGAVAGQGGHARTFDAACRIVERVTCEDDAWTVLSEWNTRCVPPWAEWELRHKLRDAMRLHAFAPEAAEGDAPASPEGEPGLDPADPASRILWVRGLQRFLAQGEDGTFDLASPLTDGGARAELVRLGLTAGKAKAVLSEVRYPQAVGLDFAPGQPSLYRAPSGHMLNTWRPSEVVPAPGDWPVIREVLDYLTGGDPAALRWLLAWCAFAVQNPGSPLRTVPVLHGAQRTGKSLLARALSDLLGPGNCATLRQADIEGRFNLGWVTRAFVHASELDAGHREATTARLKWATGEPYLMAEAKNAASIQVRNRIKLLITSNVTLPVTVEPGDTRFSLIFQPAEPPADYSRRMAGLFRRKVDWSEEGQAELAAFAWYLLHLDVDENLVSDPLVNAARLDVAKATQGTAAAFAEAVAERTLDGILLEHVRDAVAPELRYLDVPGAPGAASAAAVYLIYREWARASGQSPLSAPRLAAELRREGWEYRGRAAGEDSRLPAGQSGRRLPACWVGLPRDPSLRSPSRGEPAADAGATAEPRSAEAERVADLFRSAGLEVQP